MDKLEACFKDVIATGYQVMTPFADPSSDEVEIYGKGNKNDDLSEDSSEDGGDDAYVICGEDYPYANLEPNPSNNNPRNRDELRNELVKQISFSIDRIFDNHVTNRIYDRTPSR